MILQHCPREYKGKPYGCGYGPIHPTRAFLDYGGRCPNCGKAFRPYRKPRPKVAPSGQLCAVTSLATGKRYCDQPAVNGRYCRRHEYLNYE